MNSSTLSPGRTVGVGAAVLLVALTALGLAAVALLRADAAAARARGDTRVQSLARQFTEQVVRDGEAAPASGVVLDRTLSPLSPPPLRRLSAPPEVADDEMRFLLDLARRLAGGAVHGDPPVTVRGVLERIAAGQDEAARTEACARGAALEIREGTGRELDWVRRAQSPWTSGDGEAAIFLGLLAGDETALDRALEAVGTPGDDTAAALVVGTVLDGGARVQAVLGRRALVPVAARALRDAEILHVEGKAHRVAFVENGGAVVGLAGDSPDRIVVAFLPPERVDRLARSALKPLGAEIVGPGNSVSPAFKRRLPGSGGYAVVGRPEDGTHSRNLLVLVGLGIVSVAALVAFLAFARSVRRSEKLARMKSEFVATVGHELRTPVTVVRTAAETLLLGHATRQEDRLRLTAAILRESERLSRLLDNVLDFARMEAGRRRFDFREENLTDVVRQAVDSCRASLDQAGFRVTVEGPDDLPSVVCDRQAITTSLSNLLENAVKFSADRREAEVRLGVEGGQMLIEVVDHGWGVADGDKPRVFDRFFRGGDERVKDTRGTGIGLALVRHCVEAHGGRVEVTDTPGGGATFRLVLPLPAKGSP